MIRGFALLLLAFLTLGCGAGHGCPAGHVWNECAHGSCDVCDDCVGECQERPSSGHEEAEPSADEEGPVCGTGRCAADETCFDGGDPACPECDVVVPTCRGPRGDHAPD